MSEMAKAAADYLRKKSARITEASQQEDLPNDSVEVKTKRLQNIRLQIELLQELTSGEVDKTVSSQAKEARKMLMEQLLETMKSADE